MKRIKQFADKAFVRPDRTEVLSEGLQEAEKRIDQIKLTCESTAKKVQACLQVQGKDGVSIDKRIRKVPEFVLGSAMVTSGKQMPDNSVLGEVLCEGGQIEMKLGQAVVEFEIKIQEFVLGPLQVILDHDLPNIYKLKRQLSKLTESMDAARAKLQQASRHSMSGVTTGKIDTIKDEWEDSQQKVEQCRDNLAAEMYALLARESEISRLVVNLLNYQKEYHKSIYDILNELVPNVDAAISSSVHKPVYGVDLDEHLSTTKRTIAYPIELCICGLLETGLDEEGLFRIAGSSSKVKKLKSAFDAGILDLNGLLQEFGDPHVMANALKCYLRELPTALLTANTNLYNDWMDAIKIMDGPKKLKALWSVVQNLPKHNLDNLTYLVKFLKELCKHQEVNKMSTANIAIVIGPNLLWSTEKTEDLTGDNNPMGMNMTMTHHYSSVVDQLVSYCDYFFPDEIDFFVTCVKPTDQDLAGSRTSVQLNGLSGHPSIIEETNEALEDSMKRSQSCSSVDEQSPPHGSPKPVLRRKNKPAPVPPILSSKTSPTPTRNNSTEKDQGAQLTKTNSFKNSNRSSHLAEPPSGRSPVDKEKREGIWIPPSPSQLSNRKLKTGLDSSSTSTAATGSVTGRPLSVAPPKPPQPQFDTSRARVSHLPQQPNEPPTKPSPLKYKSSFKTSSSMDSPTGTAPAEHPSPVRHNTTDNIDSSSASNAISNSTNQFCSLPRHFSTDNSYKNQRAPRPPSMFSVAPPNVPPPPAPVSLPVRTVTPPISAAKPEAENPEDSRKGSDVQIGFEKLEQEVRKSSSDKSGEESSDEIFKVNSDSATVANNNNNNSKPEQGIFAVPNPPVPIPRASLHGSPPTVGKDKDGHGQPPVARERPSIMAKPRDLPKRTQSQNKGVIGSNPVVGQQASEGSNCGSGGESDNQEGSNASQSVVEAGNGDSDEVCRNGGPKSLPPSQQVPISPTSRVPYRPPRPHPPPPPKVKPSLGESTDL